MFESLNLQPKFSSSVSHLINTKSQFCGVDVALPIINKPLQNITGQTLAVMLDVLDGLGLVHKNMTMDELSETATYVAYLSKSIGFSLQPSQDLLERVSILQQAGIFIVNIDFYNGHHTIVTKSIEKIKNQFPNIKVIAGNVITLDGYKTLSNAGADAVRIGASSNGLFTNSGFDVHIESLISSCYNASEYSSKIIVDHNLKTTSDFVKAIALGADLVMMDFTGCEETEGDLIQVGPNKYKSYQTNELTNMTKQRLPTTTNLVEYKGHLEQVVKPYQDALVNALSFLDCLSINELRGQLA